MTETEVHVIVGGGLAGAKTAEALRSEGFDGRIVLIGAEDEQPYERPPLSKDYLRGEAPRDKAHVHDATFYTDNAIDLRIATVVESIDVDAREVVLARDERIHFDRLLLATGAEPRRLQIPGADGPGVHYLRELKDADELAERLRAGGKAVVIGAGWIGMEVAASARQVGLDVTMVEPVEVPLERALGRELGQFYADVHRDHGVELLTSSIPASIDGPAGEKRVTLADDRIVEGDFVVVGVGVTPRVALAEQAGLLVENGVIASKELETSVPGIYAAGDVASAVHPFYNRRMRVEHWANALNQPAVAARSMLGKQASYDRLPYFFSDQYEVGMEYTGDSAGSDQLVIRGELASREIIAFWLASGRVVAGMNVNVWDVTDDIKALIQSEATVDTRRLADPGTPLSELCKPRAGAVG